MNYKFYRETPLTKWFATEHDAFEYANGLTDGPATFLIQRFYFGHWQTWEEGPEKWRDNKTGVLYPSLP
jgi:hypothetical protein